MRKEKVGIKHMTITTSLIRMSPLHHGSTFDTQELDMMVESIGRVGMINGVIVRKRGRMYMLLDGALRFAAARKLGLPRVPATVVDCSDKEAPQIALSTHLHRLPLTDEERERATERLDQLLEQQASGKSRRRFTDKAER